MKKEHLIEMLQLQNTMNSLVNPQWKTAKYPWTRAIWLEAAELMEHIGWKWWKAQGTNHVQAQIELVDIWHFILSMWAERTEDYGAAAQLISERLTDKGYRVGAYQGKVVAMDDLGLRERIDLLASSAAMGNDVTSFFASVCQELNLGWDELRRLYVAKNVLNIFRQKNGYKEGTYIKIWGGAEDNVFLENVLSANPNISVSEINDTLTKEYARVTARAVA